MKIIAPNQIKENSEVETQKTKREFLLDKTIFLKLFRESFFINLKMGRDLRQQISRLGVSSGRRKFNTFVICLIGVLSLYMIIGSVIFALYTMKSRMGLDIFPNIHFFNF
jgi:hypothetical protein